MAGPISEAQQGVQNYRHQITDGSLEKNVDSHLWDGVSVGYSAAVDTVRVNNSSK